MMEQAKSHISESVSTPDKGSLRATGLLKTVKNTQPYEPSEVMYDTVREN